LIIEENFVKQLTMPHQKSAVAATVRFSFSSFSILHDFAGNARGFSKVCYFFNNIFTALAFFPGTSSNNNKSGNG